MKRETGCKVRLCGLSPRARGFCNKHYAQWRRGIIDDNGAELRKLRRVPKYIDVCCKVDECKNQIQARGFCSKHYKQWKAGMLQEDGIRIRHPDKSRPRPPRSNYRTYQRGYVKVLARDHPYADRDGYVLEHRVVMEQHLGRHLDPIEVVHHKNGVRDDNQLENLELLANRRKHAPFAERVDEINGALAVLEGLVHRGIRDGPEIKKRLQKIARRLPAQ